MPSRRCGVIVTRPRPAAMRLAALLRREGIEDANILISPLLEIVPVRQTEAPPPCDSVVFTSENGIAHIGNLEIPRRSTAYCVGSRTARAAQDAGFARVFSAPNSEALASLIAGEARAERMLYVRGRHISLDLVGMLSRKGIRLEEAVVYDQLPVAMERDAMSLLSAAPCVIPLFSARTARILGEQAAGAPELGHAACCISEQVAAAFPLSWRLSVARLPEMGFVVRDVVERVRSIESENLGNAPD